MKERSVYKKALTLAVPMMIQNGITNAVSLVDNLMVGSLGTESMTAVSIVGQLIYGKFGFPRLEVRGAAIATVMARFVEMLIVVMWTHARIQRYEFLRKVYSTILCGPEGWQH